MQPTKREIVGEHFVYTQAWLGDGYTYFPAQEPSGAYQPGDYIGTFAVPRRIEPNKKLSEPRSKKKVEEASE